MDAYFRLRAARLSVVFQRQTNPTGVARLLRTVSCRVKRTQLSQVATKEATE